MRKIAPDIYIEDEYPGVQLGMVVSDEEVLLVDCPIQVETAREWVWASAKYGKPSYLLIMDHHPERVIGARGLKIPLIGHDETRRILANLPDTFKGSAHPIGAETDSMKRITGMSRSIPDLSFTDCLKFDLGKIEVEVWHQPGPTSGAVWLVLNKAQTIFIGDAVTVAEPPYIGASDLQAWLLTLDELRSEKFRDFRFVSSRDGLIEREHINSMARFIRKVQSRINWLADRKDVDGEFERFTTELLQGFDACEKKPACALRLHNGLADLYQRLYPAED
jgi:glyoxylase-like metal-dependent hydrolase (beta-lactamase superfamily II)